MRSNWRMAGAAGFLLLAGSVLAQDRKVAEFTGTAGMAADPASPNTNLPVRGMIKCVGADNPAPADQDWPLWCPTGTRTEVKGRITVGKWMTSDPNTSGTMRWYINMSVDSATFTGAWWGSFLLDVPGKGTWEGWFWGESIGMKATVRMIGIGSGRFDQSTFMAEVNFEDMLAKPPTISGRYLEAKAQ